MSVETVAQTSALLGVYRSYPLEISGGSGSRLRGADGREYLDFVSGIGVNALGYGDSGIAATIASVVQGGVLHTSNLFATGPARDLAELLTSVSFADRVFFCNSGGEANEAAFKFARRYARAHGSGKHEIVALKNAFHGRLFGSLAATDRPAFQQPFEPLMPGVRFVEPNDRAAARAAVSIERTAAIIVEPVQGEGGVRPLDRDYLAFLRHLADEADAVLIFDEVQCGLGRIGHVFAYEAFGVTPDIVTLAKPLAGGLPMGAVLLADRVARAIQPGDHATTFGGGVLVASVAHHVVQRIATPDFIAEVRVKGERMADLLGTLAGSSVVRQVRGLGLMWGIELEGPAAPAVTAAREAGLLVTSAGENVIRLLPPLTVSFDELEEGVDIIRREALQ